MKVLVATLNGQGIKKNDFCFTIPNEPVMLGHICDKDRFNADGGCGCARAFTGITTRKGTTTAVIAEMNITEDNLMDMFIKSEDKAGWDVKDTKAIKSHVKGLLQVAEAYPSGTVFERVMWEINPRKMV